VDGAGDGRKDGDLLVLARENARDRRPAIELTPVIVGKHNRRPEESEGVD
jgi:hypothetical protein